VLPSRLPALVHVLAALIQALALTVQTLLDPVPSAVEALFRSSISFGQRDVRGQSQGYRHHDRIQVNSAHL